MQFVTLACIIIMKSSVMLKIKIKVNDVIQAPKNKNTSMHVSSLIKTLPFYDLKSICRGRIFSLVKNDFNCLVLLDLKIVH